jgi:hypothetical protein
MRDDYIRWWIHLGKLNRRTIGSTVPQLFFSKWNCHGVATVLRLRAGGPPLARLPKCPL